jgi:NADH-quinone oxidoreductase subunit N
MPANFTTLLEHNLRHLSHISPELMVTVTFLLALVFDFVVTPERRKTTAYVCILGLLVALWLNFNQHKAFIAQVENWENLTAAQRLTVMKPSVIFSGMMVHDFYGTFFKSIVLLGTIISLLLAIHARELFGRNQGEFFLLLVAVCLGGMFLASATHLLMIYLSLEALSIVSYAMAGYLRRDRKSAEAGIKYVIYGAMASGIMIFGMSYLYGMTGTMSLIDNPLTGDGIATRILNFDTTLPGWQHTRGALVVVLVMVFSGFLYKIAAVPFHYWSPDVYEGAPTVATGFFSVVPKAAGFAVLIRVLVAFFPIGGSNGHWLDYPGVETVIAVLAVLTMTLGNLAALGQNNAKRMLAYSSIAHAGYMLAGLSVLDRTAGAASVLFYLIVYLFMNLGAFLALVGLENIFGGTDLPQLRGAVRREPLLVVTLCIFLFSLTGLPPLAGFIGKYLIMVELANQQHYPMIFWIGINSVISLYYYMKLAKAVAIDKPDDETAPALQSPITYRFIAVCSSAALLLLFVRFKPVHDLCLQAIEPLMSR